MRVLKVIMFIWFISFIVPEKHLMGSGQLLLLLLSLKPIILLQMNTLDTLIFKPFLFCFKIEANLPYYIVPNIQAKMMPKDSFTPDVQGFSISASIYMVLAFTPYITILVVFLVLEKEQKQKELMRIMGMSDVAYWFSWFSTYAIILFVAILILNAIMVPAGLLGGSNYLVMVIIFYLYGLSIIMFSFLLSPFFKVAKTGGIVASILTPVLGVIAIPLISTDVADPAKWAMSLFSPTAFALVISEVMSISLNLNSQNNQSQAMSVGVDGSKIFVLYLLVLSLLLLLAL